MRLKRCPNAEKIASINRKAQAYFVLNVIFGFDDIEATVERFNSEMQPLPSDAVKQALVAHVSFFAEVVSASRIAQDAVECGALACHRCSGPVYDRLDGVAYCGREAPAEVISDSLNQ